MRRPYISFGIDELRALFQSSLNDADVLELLHYELTKRSTRGAKDLLDQVLNRRDNASQGASPEVSADAIQTADVDRNDDTSDAVEAADGVRHPDDQRKPAQSSPMRPPGTRNLPEAWQRTLSQDLTLPIGKDADLPDRFVAALTALIAEIKRSGSSQKRYELENGSRVDDAQDNTLYAFPFAADAELFDDAQIELQVQSRRVEGSIVSISAGKLVIALREDLGDGIKQAVLILDTTALLAALVTKIEQVKKGEISLNRELADHVAGEKTNPPAPAAISGSPDDDLEAAQLKAFQTAGSSAATWIWGPPGCGKTRTLGQIVRAAFDADHRQLIASNTNKAVDQVILSVCQALGRDHPAMQRGLVLRMGKIADNKLKEYAEYVTVDGIVERRTRELQERRSAVEREIERLNLLTAKSKRVLSALAELDRLSIAIGSAQSTFDSLRKDADDQARALAENKARHVRFSEELQKRRNAFFTLLSRSEDEILRDLDLENSQTPLLDARLATLKEQCRRAYDAIGEAAVRHADKRDMLAGEDRAATQKVIRDNEDRRSDLTTELREIDTKIAAIRDTIVKGARVLGATCTKAYLAVNDIGQVDTVIIDEASMVLLPVAWFVAGLAKQRVIVSGDFRQIPPIVQSEQQAIVDIVGNDPFTANGGVKTQNLVMLDTQFRMDDAICQLIAKPMYNGKLVTAAKRLPVDDGVPAPFNQPLTIIDTSDLWPFESQNAFFSRFNLMHALLARNLVHLFDKNELLAGGTALGICTPYAAQAKIVSKLLEGGRAKDLVQVGTVHSYQGDERDTMLIDIPESHGGAWNLGQFVQGLPPEHVGARLINVAVSRAKHRLIILANLTYLDAKLPSSSLLRSILYDMQEKGTVVSGRDVLALRPIENDLSGLVGQMPFERMVETFGIFDEQAFECGLEQDILAARKSVVIFSGYVTPTRVGKLGDLLRAKIAQGIKVRCVTRPPQTNGSIPREQGKEALDMLEGIGVAVDCRAKIHQKVCLIDSRIVWLGSLNALSHAGRSDETMTRAVHAGYAAAVAGHMSKKRVAPEKAATTAMEAENPRCPSCSGRSIYNEGKFGPFFVCEAGCGWRVNEKAMNNAPIDPNLPVHGPKCPKCGSKTKLKAGRLGHFYGCTKYPTCNGIAKSA